MNDLLREWAEELWQVAIPLEETGWKVQIGFIHDSIHVVIRHHRYTVFVKEQVTTPEGYARVLLLIARIYGSEPNLPPPEHQRFDAVVTYKGQYLPNGDL